MLSSVIGIVWNVDKSQVLVVQRRDVKIWVLPGGGIDPGEKPEAAVIREIKEETGLQTVVIRKAAEYSPLNALAKLTHVYECRVKEGTLSATEETRKVGFYPLNKLPQPFFSLHEEWLQEALQNPSETIRKPITQVTYWKLFTYFLQHPFRTTRFLCSKLGFPLNSKTE